MVQSLTGFGVQGNMNSSGLPHLPANKANWNNWIAQVHDWVSEQIQNGNSLQQIKNRLDQLIPTARRAEFCQYMINNFCLDGGISLPSNLHLARIDIERGSVSNYSADHVAFLLVARRQQRSVPADNPEFVFRAVPPSPAYNNSDFLVMNPMIETVTINGQRSTQVYSASAIANLLSLLPRNTHVNLVLGAEGRRITFRLNNFQRLTENDIARIISLYNRINDINNLINLSGRVTEVHLSTRPCGAGYLATDNTIALNINDPNVINITMHEMGHAVYYNTIMNRPTNSIDSRATGTPRNQQAINELRNIYYYGLAEQTYEVIDETNIFGQADAGGHPGDNYAELFASFFSAIYGNPDGLRNVVNNSYTPERSKRFLQLGIVFMNNYIFHGRLNISQANVPPLRQEEYYDALLTAAQENQNIPEPAVPPDFSLESLNAMNAERARFYTLLTIRDNAIRTIRELREEMIQFYRSRGNQNAINTINEINN